MMVSRQAQAKAGLGHVRRLSVSKYSESASELEVVFDLEHSVLRLLRYH